MKTRLVLTAVMALMVLTLALPGQAGLPNTNNDYKVLPAITRGNLAIFPVVASRSHDTSLLMTLNEGVRSGQVMVTEAGNEQGLVRGTRQIPVRRDGAEVNKLVLYNNSNRPLLLLAGEIVTGGKQDRVIGADRIVPPNAGPIHLGVFCVEPGRWVASSANFGSMGGQMAQPSVRKPAMAERDQNSVWDNVAKSNRSAVAGLAAAEKVEVESTSSYAKVFENKAVRAKVESYGGLENEQAILRDLRNRGAVGVVVAVGGRVMWADIFASTDLLTKYWPKLIRSYVAEAMTTGNGNAGADVHEAQLYVDHLSGGREVVETEPGVYRRADITGEGFRVFELTSLLPKAQFEVHITKMRDSATVGMIKRVVE
jgi:hypothetical protein